MWIKPKLTTTIHVFYYRPDYQSILQEFAWSTLDYPPECPRMRKFLEHWHRNIQARIEQIYLTWEGRQYGINFADAIFDLNRLN